MYVCMLCVYNRCETIGNSLFKLYYPGLYRGILYAIGR